jgi:hypothetical protein
MAEPSKEQDQSMEEILQSIKRIIAEEGETAPARAVPAAPAAKAASSTPANTDSAPLGTMGSDILELTDMISEEAATLNNAAPQAIDPLDTILAVAPDAQETPAAAAPAPAPTPVAPPPPAAVEPRPEPDFMPSPVATPATAPTAKAAPTARATAAAAEDDTLLSEATAFSSAQALRSLVPPAVTHIPPASPAPGFRNGDTVEDLVLEALRPMLKEWLETNLQAIVERKVQREIERISRLNAS